MKSPDRDEVRAGSRRLLLFLKHALRICLPLVLGITFMGRSLASAKERFVSSKIEGQGSIIFFCDLDGDHLKDAVLVDGLNLSIYYQDSGKGFPREPQQQVRLDDRPAVVWPARLGTNAESLLVMTSKGVTQLCFTNRTGPPIRQQIIKQQTIIPDSLDETGLKYIPFSAKTGANWPLLLVPTAGGLQVWQHHGVWHQAQIIEHAVDARIRPSVANPGYTRWYGLSMSLGDVDGDGRDDLMVMRNIAGGKQIYALYLQNTNGPFTLEPALIYTNRDDWRTALSWININRDGKLDLIKSTISDQPSFVPGLQAGKVLVAVYLADQQGRIPAEPQWVFRKDDWSSTLPLVDVDGDGYTDMILGYIPISTREGLRKMILAGKINLRLKFHFFRPGAGFSKAPDCQRNLSIYFDHQLYFDSTRRLYHERFVSLDGDFNGDGEKDLMVRDHKHEISVYYFISRTSGFSSRPDLRFRCSEPIDWFSVEDLNGDGLSDLIVRPRNQDIFRIFISKSK